MEQKQETNKRNFIKSSTTPIALRTERLSIVEEKNEIKKKITEDEKKKNRKRFSYKCLNGRNREDVLSIITTKEKTLRKMSAFFQLKEFGFFF